MNNLNKKEIMDLASYYIHHNPVDPYEAIYWAVETFLKKKNLMIIPKLPKGRDQEEIK